MPRFGERVVSEAIIDKTKSRYDGLALIDDRPEVDTNNGRATWHHIVFDHPITSTRVPHCVYEAGTIRIWRTS